ncbi:hypothetical protein I5P72_24705 [Serratia ureilytica]|uniref:hypothetical protein n=1 Tax=Serratia TaxID=613 RepID=UPI001314F4AC|nr:MULTISPECIES: hypothetical protein [Serratia]MBH3120561.1 hypothetical protein [Serratia ureilytica]HEJ6930955.1 hypothetical protein [Serratia marcescens]HEJ7075817.1 hypothetical protein [Serratia marcescens]HEJ7199154.1 hypothetical protein [Serratia marcescens]HEJ9033220.1 hypothetical protein [Serratia marcescens]
MKKEIKHTRKPFLRHAVFDTKEEFSIAIFILIGFFAIISSLVLVFAWIIIAIDL